MSYLIGDSDSDSSSSGNVADGLLLLSGNPCSRGLAAPTLQHPQPCHTPVRLRPAEDGGRLIGGNWDYFRMQCGLFAQAARNAQQPNPLATGGDSEQLAQTHGYVHHEPHDQPSPFRQPTWDSLYNGQRRGPLRGRQFPGQ